MAALLQKHSIWMSRGMREAARRALLWVNDERGLVAHVVDLRQALDNYTTSAGGENVHLTYEEGDVLAHICARELADTTRLWTLGDAKDDNRNHAQQLVMVLNQVTKAKVGM